MFTLLAAMLSFGSAGAPDPALLTVAESSAYEATSTYDDVVALIDRLAARSPLIRRAAMGTTVEGRSIPLVIVADPPVDSAAAARATGKPIVFLLGNIHAGEVCGKEAILMFLREIALQPRHPLLEHLVFVAAPIYNADGNERFAPDNRPGQVGPREMGRRPNAQDLDLNRDYIKLESPEAQALIRLLTEWDPHVTIDTHTTNGSHHRYTLTYDAPLNPSGHPAPIDFIRRDLLPAVTARLRERTGYETFFYGNFNREHTVWATYSAEPRFGGSYQGLRGQMSVLSEAYSYATFRDRVLCTLEFMREVVGFVDEQRDRVLALHDRARRETTDAGRTPQPHDTVGIRHTFLAAPEPVTLKGFEMTIGADGRPEPTDVPRDYAVVHLAEFRPTRSVPRPLAYLVPPGHDAILEKLGQHGVEMEPWSGRARVEQYTVTSIERSPREFQGHRNVLVEASATVEDRMFVRGTTMVRTAQPLGNLIVYMLEPESEDGLVAWNFFDDILTEGGAYPIARVRSEADLK